VCAVRCPRSYAMRSADGLIGFVRLLRDNGIRVTVGQTLDLHRALAAIDIADRELFYCTARALLLSRHVDEPLFATLFARYWLNQPVITGLSRSIPRPAANSTAGEESDPEIASDAVVALRLVLDTAEEVDETGDDQSDGQRRDVIATFSPAEVLRQRDFAELTAQELAEVRRLIAELRWTPATRRQRRTKRARKGPHPDPRRALRESLANGGEVLQIPRRAHRRKTPQLVLLCDISGSMARYTSLLLRFLHALRQGRGSVETFVFGTRLTRVTRQLRTRDTDQAIAAVAAEVVDWNGGTRIGACLADFNRRWSRRMLGHDAVTVVISDGWDRGDPAQLAAELAHLQRLSYRLVWLNPLLGVAGYQPLTRGMRAALPYIDDFLAAHNLASLEALAAFLAHLDQHRPERRQFTRQVIL
jgi:uncharacterized protein with von Willebrand factor type A (vWA) domain